MILVLKAVTAALLIAFSIGAALLGCREPPPRAGRTDEERIPTEWMGTVPDTPTERRLIASTPRFALEVDLRAAAFEGADRAGIYVGSTPQYHRKATRQP